MRHIFKTVSLSSAMVFAVGTMQASAKDISPFAMAKSEAKLSKTDKNYLSAGQKLSTTELTALDAKLLATYGQPTSVRGSLKIWEIPNDDKSSGQADHTTIMCGIDRDGSQVFVIDARGASRGNNPRLFGTAPQPKASSSPVTRQRSAPHIKQNDWD